MKIQLLFILLLLPLAFAINESQESSNSKYIQLSVPVVTNSSESTQEETSNFITEEVTSTKENSKEINQTFQKSIIKENKKLIFYFLGIAIFLVLFNFFSLRYLRKLKNKIKNN